MAIALHSELAGAVALLVVIREMGNGVVRVEAARLLKAFSVDDVEGCVALHPPFSSVVADSILIAKRFLGIECSHEITQAQARPMCDTITELYCLL